MRGQVLKINCCGMFGEQMSERDKASPGTGGDGYTYFGSNMYEELDDQGY